MVESQSWHRWPDSLARPAKSSSEPVGEPAGNGYVSARLVP
jgi:hypothetical protein